MTTDDRRPRGARVLVVQPSINPPGGGNAVACWMIEALTGDCDVTLFTRDAPDFDAANRAFGTTLSDNRVHVRQAEVGGGWVARMLRPVANLGLLRDHRLLEQARRLGPAFDVVVTANNESDLGRL